ncbi:hypothetical protein BO70DRAFT_358492 [Aspergillus heteromorphus CBS 117.55]|uniref:Uncharacterized protein n=1 Tax=Aspergillus heteromorphus CBS 117.55 TaxID=1448321 RepID=A0A317WXH7_9EURO|nr:uncharacterized protein BO70DRAFT_358492 [Aspergillus heteromorphus CBS 117.55]PWY91053.1 hypothetical protein BO70DRAFT_358492 [Aspergillus heteromorphus CBS 117.55]
MVEQHTPDPWAFPLGALYLFLLLSILVLHCYVGSSDTAEEEAGARGQATAEEGTGRRGVRFDDVPEIIEVPALDVESTTMDEVLSLLGEIQEDMAGLAGRIDRLSSKMGSHIEHLADRISDADNRSRVLPLLDWEEERFNSFWVVLEDHVQESFQEQLARVSEVAEVIQRAGQDLLQPDEYEALTRNLCDEIDYSLGVVTKLRQRVASEASSS